MHYLKCAFKRGDVNLPKPCLILYLPKAGIIPKVGKKFVPKWVKKFYPNHVKNPSGQRYILPKAGTLPKVGRIFYLNRVNRFFKKTQVR
ncbi:hypothetical protein BCU68_11850 [Vibrio sp. 10N.286.49.B3]|nr:hypothetical protein BCU68_11850 [Vibrio sp. 10N.286.49.B3]